MKVLFSALKYDYGLPERGESLERKAFLPALQSVVDEVYVFWLEEQGYLTDVNLLQKNLLEYADAVKPDLVFFILMDDEIKLSTIKILTKKYGTINWFCDDQWRFDSFTRRVAPELSAVITVDKYSVNKYFQLGCDKVFLSQWATIDYQENLDLDNVNYKYDITFIGSKNPTREWIIEELRNADIYVTCFGAGWDNGRISYEEIRDVFLTSKINLNLSNSVPNDIAFLKYIMRKLLLSILKLPIRHPQKSKDLIAKYLQYLRFYFRGNKTTEQIKARNFEIPGCGGFKLSQFALETEDYYQIGTEIATFTNITELVKQCKYYLQNDLVRENMKKKGYKRTSEHTYNKRINEVLYQLKKHQIPNN